MSFVKYDSAESKPMVFISYAHEDWQIVEKFADYFCEQGYHIWFDKTRLEIGDEFNVEINQNIKNCAIMLCFLSKNYVRKPYCKLEFNNAIDNRRSIATVCLDDVDKETNADAEYMFSRYSGYNVLRYGTGVRDEKEFKEVCEELNASSLFQYALMSDEERAKNAMHFNTTTALRDRLAFHRKSVYKISGNYYLDEIHAELFSQLKDEDFRIVYQDADKNEVPLYNYLKQHSDQHLLLVGDGGMGKTVSMLRTCEYLLNQGIPAVYIPLRAIDFAHETLEGYIANVVCANQGYYNELVEVHAKSPYQGTPNVVVLLDGMNEIPADMMSKLIRGQLIGKIMQNWKGAQIIMSSRYDFRATENLEKDVRVLYMQNLESRRVEQYLEKCGLPQVNDRAVLELLGNPLLLSLYTNAEACRARYSQIPGIELDEVPNTAGKIIGNFLKTQLFRASKEVNMRLAEHLVVLEYVLPAIADYMISGERYSISRNELSELLMDLEEEDTRFKWYKRERLQNIMMTLGLDGYSWNSMKLFNLATRGLHLLNETGGSSYEFLHQNFRDYFAAYYLVNEISAVAARPKRQKDVDMAVGRQEYSGDILRLASNISGEEEAKPYLEDGKWIFPGKDDCSLPSSKSAAEQMLALQRGKEGKEARNIVHNLLEIMRMGRENFLAWCDFSDLDLRSCYLNKCRFVVWYKDEIYPSRFDGAWMDRTFLLNEGHEGQVKAVCTDGANRIFSGDEDGYVKVFDLDKKKWLYTVQPQSGTVVDLAWDAKKGYLAVLYADAVYVFAADTMSEIMRVENAHRSKKYRYVRFDEESSVEMAYDIEPLIYYTIYGERLANGMDYDVTTKCAKWHPFRKEYIRSYMFQMISSNFFNEETGNWWQHKALLKKRDDLNVIRKANNIPLLHKCYLRLRDDGADDKDSTRCICYHPDGDRFLVAIQRLVLEYDNRTMTLIQKRRLNEPVYCVCYGKNDAVYVGSGNSVVVLGSDFSKQYTLTGVQMSALLSKNMGPEGKDYYLFSRNGEIKRLDENLCVQRMHTYSESGSSPIWGKDRMTGEYQMLFLPSRRYPYGSRLNFETGEVAPLGWSYEVQDAELFKEKSTKKLHKLETSVLAVDKKPPYRKTVFVNYRGVWIFGCSFKGIQGSMAEEKNLYFLKQNGGHVDE